MVLIRVLANLLILQLSYAQKSSELIIGGDECNINEHRFLALVYSDGNRCGGTLINEEWVLTAAHCEGNKMKIHLGVHSKMVPNKDKQTRVPKEKFFCVSSKNYTFWDKDIMLIRLDRPVSNSEHIAPLSLPSSPPSVGSVCRIMGWGTISPTEALYEYWSQSFLCGGTLINKEWVLTAKHCDRTHILIYVGVHDRSVQFDKEQRRFPKEKYFFDCTNNFTKWDKDIMLIRLNKPVSYSEHIAPLSLPSSPPIVGSVCRVMGWGQTTSPQETLPDVPHCANINLLDYEVCRTTHPQFRLPATSRILCAGVLEGGINTCHRDSGGPLICNGQFQGIVSWGDGSCAQPDKPALYSKVFDHLDWIQNIIAGSETVNCPL